MWVQGRDSHDALEAQVVSRCAATASPTSGMLVTARARQLAFVDLARAATAALVQPDGKGILPSHIFLSTLLATFAVLRMHEYLELQPHRSFLSCNVFAKTCYTSNTGLMGQLAVCSSMQPG